MFYLAESTVHQSLRVISRSVKDRTLASMLFSVLFLLARMVRCGQETIYVRSSGQNSVGPELDKYVRLAQGWEKPYVNPFDSMKSGRLEYRSVDAARSVVYTALGSGRVLKYLGAPKTKNGYEVTLSSEFLDSIGETLQKAGIRIPLQYVAIFFMRNEAFESRNLSEVVERFKHAFKLQDHADKWFVEARLDMVVVSWADHPYRNLVGILPDDLAPPNASQTNRHFLYDTGSSTDLVALPRRPPPIRRDSFVSGHEEEIRRLVQINKAVALDGIPGTGKNTIWENLLSEALERPGLLGFSNPMEWMVTTGQEDWTTGDLVGTQHSMNGETFFAKGVVLHAIEQNKILVIDEMNRADMNRVVGPLMTFLGDHSVTLGIETYRESTRSIILEWSDKPNCEVVRDKKAVRYLVGTNWRLLGSFNDTDGLTTHRLGDALFRRFPVVNVKPLDIDGLKRALEHHGTTQYPDCILALYKLHLEKFPLSQSFFIKLARHIERFEGTDGIEAEAYEAYIVPQLRNMTNGDITEFAQSVGSILGHGIEHNICERYKR